ncbi:hypothetical protein [Radiobacillus deserti]|uniref:MucB/RseB N-terminal domain-containing protein n=1 Tax=Radiobacillus deserti TaxID=2594883 RepID=A0A516KJM2_9BACI|nr:hypothetical protein [Radiobacillus deserti]QDP41577.1 hypothetical protein FN924_16205 [Radiobacillus deserti]
MKKYVIYAFSVVLLLTISFIGIKSFSGNNSAVNHLSPSKVSASSVNETLDPKENIQLMMYNATDNYKKVKGSFTYMSKGIGEEFVVDYKVKTKDGAFSSIKVKSKTSNTSFETLYDQSKKSVIRVSHKNKDVIKSRASDIVEKETKRISNVDPKDNTYTNEKGEKVFERRADPTYMGGLATTSLFPQDIAASFLEDYDKWKIVSKNEKINDLNAVLIEGTLSDYFKTKHNAETFKLWVHSETGILLQMEEYDVDGNIVESLKTNEIKLNDNVNNTKPKINIPSNYKENI